MRGRRVLNELKSGITTASPLIIVGMPRCGSTIFTQVLNQSQDLLIVNDFYYLQFVDEINAFNSNTLEIQKQLVDYIKYWITRRINRIGDESIGGGIGSGLEITPEQETKIIDFIQNFQYSSRKNWASILQEILEYTVNIVGKQAWGYNTPQDYLNLDLLKKAYPESKIVFVIRDCRSMLGSYKYIIKEYDYNNDRNRYHPILQSLAWRTAVRAFINYRKNSPDNIVLVRYEDLVNNTQNTIHTISEFTVADFPQIDLKDFGNNSSFRNKKRKQITNTEIWLCEKMAGEELEQLGYPVSGKTFKIRDLGDLALTTLRSTYFYSHKIITSANIRKRILKLVKQILS